MADSGHRHHAVGDSFVSHTVIQLAHVLGRHTDRVLASFNLSTTSFSVLFHVFSEPSVSAAELARRVAITPQSAGPVLDRLEANGLVVRHRSGVRGAKVLTELTEAGRDRLDAAVQAVAALDAWLVADLDPATSDALTDLLSRLLARATRDAPPEA